MSQPPLNTESTPPTLAGRLRNRLKYSPRLIPDTFWTLTNNLFTAASGILIFKVISKLVPASEYGQASLVLGIVALLNNLVAGPAILAHLRLYFQHSKEGSGNLYARAVSRLLIKTAVMMSGVYLVIALAYLAVADRVYWQLAIPAVLLLFTQTQQTGTFAFLEAEKNYRGLMVAQSLSKVLQLPFLILLLWLVASGPASVVSSQVLAAGTVALIWGFFAMKKAPPGASEQEFSQKQIRESAWRVFGWSLYLFNLF